MSDHWKEKHPRFDTPRFKWLKVIEKPSNIPNTLSQTTKLNLSKIKDQEKYKSEQLNEETKTPVSPSYTLIINDKQAVVKPEFQDPTKLLEKCTEKFNQTKNLSQPLNKT